MSSSSSSSASAGLSGKDLNLFKQIEHLFDRKDFKKALKNCNDILANNSNHSGTLAFRALVLSAMGKKEEAFQSAKMSLMYDMSSAKAWHIYGVLHRTEGDHAESKKCFAKALQLDPGNAVMMSDLGRSQIHTRDYDGYLESRRAQLQERPTFKNNWLGFIVAAYLAKDYQTAIDAVDKFVDTTYADEGTAEEGETEEKGAKKKSSLTPFQMSELQLFRNLAVYKANSNAQEALDHLLSIKDLVVDTLYWQERKLELELALGQTSGAQETLEALMALNPDNNLYYQRALECQGVHVVEGQQLSEEEQDKVVALFAEMADKYPRAMAITRFPLDHLHGHRFVSALRAYLEPKLVKGVPSAFLDIKSLYSDSDKVSQIQSLLEGYEANLKSKGVFGEEGDGVVVKEVEESKVGMTLVWTQLFLARHHDYLGQYEEAMAWMAKAEEGCGEPNAENKMDVVELWMAKARLIKHTGDLKGAAEVYDAARALDTDDRYLCTKCVKYMLRADMVEEAEARMKLFATSPGHPVMNAFDMQTLWYEVELGQSWMRQGRPARALRNLSHLVGHFEQFVKDETDFHYYCLRKMTLRSYVELLEVQDRIYNHKAFWAGAHSMIQAYLEVDVHPPKDDAQRAKDQEDKMFANLDPKARKKALSKWRREQRKKEADAKAAEASKKKKGGAHRLSEHEKDPEGLEMVANTKDLVGEALSLVRKLESQCPQRIDTWLLSFDVAMRRRKYVQALRAVMHMVAMDSVHPEVAVRVARFGQVVLEGGRDGSAPGASSSSAGASSASGEEAVDAQVLEIAQTHVGDVLRLNDSTYSNVGEYVAAYKAGHSDSLLGVFAGSQCDRVLDADAEVNWAACASQLDAADASVKTASNVYRALLQMDDLEKVPGTADAASALKAAAAAKWPKATLFAE